MEKSIIRKCHRKFWFVVLLSFLFWLVLLSFDNPALVLLDYANEAIDSSSNVGNLTSEVTGKPVNGIEKKKEPVYVPSSPKHHVNSDLDSCLGRYIYVHSLPYRFNDELLKNCHSLTQWTDMCPYVLNLGLGPQVENSKNILLSKSWFSTNQFTLEVIFHNRMKQYKCLTNDSSLASAIFVPYYAGLDVGRYLWGFNTSVRDSSPSDLVKWLSGRPEWKRMLGRDHFFVAGRIAWDFRRKSDNDSDWGNKLMFLPESNNMTMLSIESGVWKNDFAIPYPTYFHPSSNSEVLQWQDRMRRRKRRYLFSFAGARRPSQENSIRGELIKQCQASGRACQLLDCASDASKCDNPINVIRTFQNSIFCLQPPGDSYTRRSAFDSMLAGCIPVFFHPGSAYDQYLWYLPKNYSKYSVFIPLNDVKDEKVWINKTLRRVPRNEISSMRQEVISLIPKVIYADPRSRLLETLEDAFDIAVKGVLERVETVRREIKDGKDPSVWFS